MPQFVLYGASLVGDKVLLPLDILRMGPTYLPYAPGEKVIMPHDRVLADLVQTGEPMRLFAVAEVRAGRMPLWNPYNYCGSPFLASNYPAVFSPFRVVDYIFPGPRTIAWVQLLKSVVAGLGAYLYFRRVLAIGYWPAAITAWCYPLGSVFIFWAVYPLSFVLLWLPWLLLFVDGAVRQPGGASAPLLGLVTAALLVCGHLATAAQVLLAGGMYFLWCLVDQHSWRGLWSAAAAKSIAAVTLAWMLGFLLSAPQNLPTAEYLRISRRVASRQVGKVEDPPVGLSGLPQLVLPYFYGTSQQGSAYIAPRNLIESPAQAYAGLVLTLSVAPLGLSSRRHRSINLFWLVAAIVSAGYILDVPGIVHFYQLFPLNLLRNNRFVFLAAWCVLSLAAVGLEQIARGEARWRDVYFVPLVLLVALGGWCILRSVYLPLADLPKPGAVYNVPVDPVAIYGWFRRMYVSAAVICAAGALFWVALWTGQMARRGAIFAVGLLALVEIVFTAYGFNAQSERALYYPRLPALVALSTAERGRVCGVYCLPPMLNLSHRLADIRGYDGVDPNYYIELLDLCRSEPLKPGRFQYAVTHWYYPVNSPILDMLNLRYRIILGAPTAQARFAAEGYNVVENTRALPRPFVPSRVRTVESKETLLRELARKDFDPREVAYVEGRVSLGESPCRGTARIVREIPCQVDIATEMDTDGLVVLADLWYPGWKAYLDGSAVPVHRVNHALRGVIVPQGKRQLVFRYEPASFTWGVRGALVALALLSVWTSLAWWNRQS